MGCLLEKLKKLKLNKVEQLQQPFVDNKIQFEQKQPNTFIPLQIIAQANEQRILGMQEKNCSRNFQIEYYERLKKLQKCEEYKIKNQGKGNYALRWTINN